jgi:hypothetical protein
MGQSFLYLITRLISTPMRRDNWWRKPFTRRDICPTKPTFLRFEENKRGGKYPTVED